MVKVQGSHPFHNCTKTPLTGSPQWEERKGMKSLNLTPSLFKVSYVYA